MAARQIKKTTEEKAVTKNVVNEVEAPIIENKPIKKKFEPTDAISCKSITSGELILNGNSGSNYSWSDLGEYCEVEYRDLVLLVRSGSDYIKKPYFIIEDEDFLKEFPKVKEAYEALYTVKDLKDILRMPSTQIKSVVETLPIGAKTSLRNLASTMISNGQLDSVKTIKVLDEIFGTELMLLTGLVAD